jgi:hypothetical protein
MGVVKYIFSLLFVVSDLFNSEKPKRVVMTLPIVFKMK